MINSAPLLCDNYQKPLSAFYYNFGPALKDVDMGSGELKCGSVPFFLIILMIGRGQDHGVHSKQTTVVARLDLPNCSCLHTNTIREVHLEDELEFDEPVVVSSRAEQTANLITRRVEVRYLKKKYIVEDVYQFDYSPGKETQAEMASDSVESSYEKIRSDEPTPIRENQKLANKFKKVCIFQKQTNNEKRNTKNLPKNFFKGFMAFVESKSKMQNLEDLLRLLGNVAKGAKYNNILIQKLLSNSRIAPYFREFLEDHAQQWICGSKITDKSMHLEAIPIYLSLFSKYHYAEGDSASSSEQ